MFKVRRFLVALACGPLLLMIFAFPARANTESISDGNDVNGPLDIHYVRAGHSGTAVTVTIVTYGPWTPSMLTNEGAFEVAFDTNANAKVIERWAVVVYRSKLAAVIADRYHQVQGFAKVSKPNARTVTITISRDLLGNPAGYYWQAESYYKTATVCLNVCVDWAPNHSRVLHDITPPTVTTHFPQISTDVSATTDFPLQFSTADKGYSGLKSWKLQDRVLGATTWSTRASGSTSGSHTPSFNGTEGANYEFRVQAVDKQGNRKVTPAKNVMVPFDDQNGTGAIVFTGTWSTDDSNSNNYEGTLTESSTVGDTFAYTFTGSEVVVVYPTTTGGSADVSLDGNNVGSIDEGCCGTFRQSEAYMPGPGSHTLIVKVVTGPFAIDGVASM